MDDRDLLLAMLLADRQSPIKRQGCGCLPLGIVIVGLILIWFPWEQIIK